MINKGVIGVLGFITGAIFGWFAAAKVTANKYEEIIDKEVESVKEAFRKDQAKTVKKDEPVAPAQTPPEKPDIKSYRASITENKYAEKTEPVQTKKAHKITQKEFGNADYEEINLEYYADGTLTDDSFHPMSDKEICDAIDTKEFLKDMMDNGEDAIYIRNDRTKADYEIMFNPTTYADLLRERPYLAN
jgi:hypothetical protein